MSDHRKINRASINLILSNRATIRIIIVNLSIQRRAYGRNVIRRQEMRRLLLRTLNRLLVKDGSVEIILRRTFGHLVINERSDLTAYSQ